MPDQVAKLRIRNEQDADTALAYFKLLETHGKVESRPSAPAFAGGVRRFVSALAEWEHAYRFRTVASIGPLVGEVKASLANHPFGAEMSAILDAIVERLREKDREATGEGLIAQLHALGFDTAAIVRR
ncbi:MAG: hypothetical protein JNK93_13990 [Planctomycetia bacterium]|nr:hypothetical protein [Planctomycetia bacterium]